MNVMSERPSFLQAHAVSGFIRWAALFVAVGALLYLGGIVWTGWDAVLAALAKLGFPVLCTGAALASFTYIARFGRWHLALRWLGSRVPWTLNLQVYLGGLALTASPGKLGETFRSVLLLPHGVPVARSMGTFLADRLSDVLGVCLLGASAGWLQDRSLNPAAVGFITVLLLSMVLRALVVYPVLAKLAASLPSWTQRPKKMASDAMRQWAILWRPGRIILFVLVASLAYGLQAAVFGWYCHILGIQLPPLKAVEIFSNAILLGAASMVPGGLGAMEAALVVQLVDQGAEMSVAVSVAIAVRLVTLWMGVLIGVMSLLMVASRLRSALPVKA